MAWQRLEELEAMMRHNNSVIDLQLAGDINAIGLLDERKLCQAINASRKIFELQYNVSVSQSNGTFTCYYYMYEGVNHAVPLQNNEASRKKLHPRAKSFIEFVEAANFAAHAIRNYRINLLQKENHDSTVQIILQVPKLYRAFREDSARGLTRIC